MDRRVKELFERNYPVVMESEASKGGEVVFVASLVDFPECVAEGASETEAFNGLIGMLPAFFEGLLRLGVEIPPPSAEYGIATREFGFYDATTGAPMNHPLATNFVESEANRSGRAVSQAPSGARAEIVGQKSRAAWARPDPATC